VTAPVPCAEIAADALALEALPPDAPERASAEAHARTCADCTRALDEARGLLALLDTAAPPAPSSSALARASAAVVAESDREAAGRAGLAVSAAVLAVWALPLALMRAPVESGPPFTLSLALAVLALTASVATVVWSRRAALAFPLLSALTALVVGRGSELAPALGVHCASIEALTALGAGAAAWLLMRGLGRGRGGPTLSPSPGAASLELAAVGGGALAGHAALHLGCSAAGELPHLLAFHTGPVTVAVGLALLAAAARGRAAVRGSSRP
jgi:hypothetical protein